MGASNLKQRWHHFSQFLFNVKKYLQNFQRLAGLWLVGEVVNRIEIFGSKAVEGLWRSNVGLAMLWINCNHRGNLHRIILSALKINMRLHTKFMSVVTTCEEPTKLLTMMPEKGQAIMQKSANDNAHSHNCPQLLRKYALLLLATTMITYKCFIYYLVIIIFIIVIIIIITSSSSLLLSLSFSHSSRHSDNDNFIYHNYNWLLLIWEKTVTLFINSL